MSSVSIAREIAVRTFGKRLVSTLEAKGLTFQGVQAGPAYEGDQINSGMDFVVVINGTGCVRTYSQLMAMAASSWTAASELEDDGEDYSYLLQDGSRLQVCEYSVPGMAGESMWIIELTIRGNRVTLDSIRHLLSKVDCEEIEAWINQTSENNFDFLTT